jgi:hypothetical protein
VSTSSTGSLASTLFASALLVLVPQAAGAGLLGSASLTIDGTNLLPPLSFPATAATGFAASSSSVSLGGGTAFNGTATAFAPTFVVTTLQVALTGNSPGSFTGVPLSGSAGFSGLLRLQAFGGFPVTTIPVTLGKPGSVTQPFILPTGGVPAALRLTFRGWTAGTTTVVTTGGTHMATGLNSLSPGGAGTLNLVSPVVVTSFSGGPPPASPNGVAFANLQLNFVPEPGTLVLTLWGAAFIVLMGLRRERRR